MKKTPTYFDMIRCLFLQAKLGGKVLEKSIYLGYNKNRSDIKIHLCNATSDERSEAADAACDDYNR